MERQYIKNVSPTTVKWYRSSFKVFAGCGLEDAQSRPFASTAAAIKARIIEVSKSGQTATSINTYLRVINAYLHWLQQEGHIKEPVRCIPRLKEEQLVITPFRQEQIHALLSHRPRSRNAARVHAIAALILDTGVRIEEALNLRRDDVDMENLLIKVDGKGRKQRIVPISMQGRRVMFRWLQGHEHERVFPVAGGGRMSQRNALRDPNVLCKRAGITGVRTSWHTLRHTFALNYIRVGGSVFHLQRILGHSSLEMTRRYVHLQMEDLQKVHERFSALARSAW